MIQRFEDFHPAFTFFYYMGVILLLMMFQHPTILVIALLIILMIHFVEDRFQNLKRWSLLIILSGVLIILLNPVFNQRGRIVLFIIGDHYITLEAVLNGSVTALSIMAIISIFVSYNEVMTPNKLLFLFSKLLPQFAVLLMLTLRFIPLMRRRLEEISAVQYSKGIAVTDGNWRKKVKNGLLYIQVLVTYSLEEAIQTADSMNAREYGKGERTTYDHFRFKKIDAVAFLWVGFLLIYCVIGRLYGFGVLTIYPMMDPIPLTGMEWCLAIGMFIFIAFPLVVKGGGRLKWRILISKM
ncbi:MULTISPECIES: energy-coupling factor transporter transmembrane component T [Bacillaceae]|uniref:Energy-coupling factor transporter transmembrane protein EcfT n=1 Tax=Evansella alkalicola TaxID=745819 RepID=A0ABS6JXR7_9BACI|nr:MULTISPECIES: energy-coupling factor transporter transmembrane component T [Bacillaceae]MBU9723373.1 energy-coupling factor transporter transmembrane protein EcfT [Bacillus alkalicola]